MSAENPLQPGSNLDAQKKVSQIETNPKSVIILDPNIRLSREKRKPAKSSPKKEKTKNGRKWDNVASNESGVNSTKSLLLANKVPPLLNKEKKSKSYESIRNKALLALTVWMLSLSIMACGDVTEGNVTIPAPNNSISSVPILPTESIKIVRSPVTPEVKTYSISNRLEQFNKTNAGFKLKSFSAIENSNFCEDGKCGPDPTVHELKDTKEDFQYLENFIKGPLSNFQKLLPIQFLKKIGLETVLFMLGMTDDAFGLAPTAGVIVVGPKKASEILSTKILIHEALHQLVFMASNSSDPELIKFIDEFTKAGKNIPYGEVKDIDPPDFVAAYAATNMNEDIAMTGAEMFIQNDGNLIALHDKFVRSGVLAHKIAALSRVLEYLGIKLEEVPYFKMFPQDLKYVKSPLSHP